MLRTGNLQSLGLMTARLGGWCNGDGSCARDPCTRATREPITDWSLPGLKEKPVKIGATGISHGRRFAFQIAGGAIPGRFPPGNLRPIAELWRPPDPSPARTARSSCAAEKS